MPISLKAYTDAALTTPLAGNLIVSQEAGGTAVDKLIYLGSTVAASIFQNDASPGVGQITASIANTTALWQASTVYALNALARTTTKNGYQYQVTAVAGASTSAAAEPAWPTVIGNTVVDGDLTWTNIGKLHESTEVTLALTAGALATNTPGAPLDLGIQINGGAANAVPLYVRANDATGVVATQTELSLTTNTIRET